MNVLIIGSGGREHALAWKIAQSALVDEVWSAPGNPGMDAIGPCFDVKVDDLEAIQKLVLQLSPDLIVVGPEQPLSLGVSDMLRARGFDVFGPSKTAAQLESSKGFSKDRMRKYGVPTAAYGRFTEAVPAKAFLDGMTAPYVLKADGLAAGKGVVIAESREEAEAEIDDMLSGKFGDASAELVIEEFMDGEEASVFVLTDGSGAVYLPPAQDHKRVGDGDTGPNTGGMGAYAPAPVMDDAMLARLKTEIAEPMIAGMAKDDMPYQGVLYIGVMVTADGPKVVEFNARFGDPECQVLMMRLKSDIVDALSAAADGRLEDVTPEWHNHAALTVVMAANGYPGSYEKGSVINGLDQAGADADVHVFHAGTALNSEGAVTATGGRVLNVTALGQSITDAQARAYAAVDRVDWPGGFNRRDIGWRAVEREKAGE